MYKLLIFLNKTDDDKILIHFKEYTLKYLTEIYGREIEIGKVESSLLLEQKYSYFCELVFESKEEWDEKINSRAGKELNKDLTEFHRFISFIFVNYNNLV